MENEVISVRVPGNLMYIHFINDTSELLFKARITFYSEELYNDFVQDMRIIMYELFSNAVHHSKSDELTVEFELTDDTISVTFMTNNIGYGIKRMDMKVEGTDEHPIIFPPYYPEFLNKEFIVYRDIQNEVVCKVTGAFSTEFHNRKNIVHRNDVTDIPEHYGLNLITKLAHKTAYRRKEKGVDCFTIMKRLR